MNILTYRRKYVPKSAKVEIIIKALCEKSPRTINELAENLASRLGLKFTTARSTASRIVSSFLELDILEEAGTDRKGSRLIEISPAGAYVIARNLPDFKTEFLKKEDVVKLLLRKSSKAADALEVYYVLRRETEEELGAEDFYDAITLDMELEDVEISSWDELADEIISLCTSQIERYLDRKGGILDLRELMKTLPEKIKKTYVRILYAYLDEIDEELGKLTLRKEKVKELIKETETS